MRKELAEEIEKMLQGVQKQLQDSQKLMLQSIVGLCSVILAHLHNEDYEKAKNSLVSLITQLESRREDA
jgi:exonuclease VII small subunit